MWSLRHVLRCYGGGVESTNEESVPPSLGRVIGENLKTIREGKRLTQPQLAAELAMTGLPWKRSQIADVERGRREAIDFGTLLVLAKALDVPVGRFFEGDGEVALTPQADFGEYGAKARRSELRGWVSDHVPDVTVCGAAAVSAAMRYWRWQGREVPAEADILLARKLDVDPWKVIDAAEKVWNGSITEERDRRVAALGDLSPRERQAKQGHITRQMYAVVTKLIQADAAGGSDG
jgi:transcriptional regulator with XRE-family HTH domain